MDWSPLVLVTTGLLVAGVLKGTTGLGYSSCALPFLVSAVGLKPAMALVLVPAVATNLRVTITAGHCVEMVRRFSWLYTAMLPGVAVGTGLLTWLPQSIAVRTLGIVIVGYSIMSLLRPQFLMSQSVEWTLQIPTGFANGVIAGLTGSQVMPLLPFMMALKLDPARLVQSINIAVSLASAFLAVGLIATGIMTPSLALASLAAVAPAMAGVEIGSKLRVRIPAERFRSIVLCTLLGSGLLLLGK